MSTKRLQDCSEQDSEQPNEKRLRRNLSLATVIRQAMMAQTIQNAFMAMEPMLRTVVQEELDRIIGQITCINPRSSQAQPEESEAPTLQLKFKKPLSLPIFTGKKIEDVDGNPLQIHLVDRKNGQQIAPLVSPSPLKLEIVVIDGYFPPGDQQNWSSEEFDKHIVKERDGKRPLIIGELGLTLRGTGCCSVGDLTITDNSSWVKSRHFRIGVRVAAGKEPRIMEAMTERFKVKDQRGETYQKHYPPTLADDVWRLEKIRKDGNIHKRLADENIHTVGDLLRLHSVDPARIKRILKMGMSDRACEATLNHASTCTLDHSIYMYRGSQCNLLLNSICELQGVRVQNLTLYPQDLTMSQRVFVQQLTREAYDHWEMVEEIGGDVFGFDQSWNNEEMENMFSVE